MTAEEYAAAQAAIAAAVASYILTFSTFFVNPLLTVAQWVGLLQLLFPEVERARFESADLARRFYDSERRLHQPELPRHDVFLEQYDFPTFVKRMEPARKQMSAAQAPKKAVANMVFHSVREVENAGREQIVRAVEADAQVFTEYVIPETRAQAEPPRVQLQMELDEVKLQRTAREILNERLGKSDPVVEVPKQKNLVVPAAGPVRGWARVATGKETCAWCLMLISRGPVYLSSKGAGLDLHDAGAAASLQEGKDVSQWMNEWHIGCDCKVVPVYDKYEWPGRDAAKRAMELWNDADDDAQAWIDTHPNRVHLTGKNKGQAITWNEEKVLALRRQLESGAISTAEFSAFAA